MENPLASDDGLLVGQRSLVYLRREWLSDLRSENRSTNTIKWYGAKLEYLERQTGIKTLDQLTKGVINSFLAGIADGTLPDSKKQGSDAYRAGFWRAIKAFIYWCRRNGYEPHHSLLNNEQKFSLRKPKEEDVIIEIFTPDEVEKMREIAHHIGARELLAVEILLSTGIRMFELVNIELDDIQGSNLKVRGKGRKVRYPPLPTRLQKMLSVYQRKYRPGSPTDKLFLTDNGQPLSWWGMNSLLKRLQKITGIHIHAHKFRHTFATRYLEKNPGQIEKLRLILGHSDYKVLMRYLHLAGQQAIADSYDEDDPFR